MKKYFPLLAVVILPVIIYLFNGLQPLNDLYKDWLLNIPIIVIIGLLTFLLLEM
ncbi:hypothetical protein [Tepidibacillus marianensis]|uniref:hypothetical protein n=1 Tax=Tepidibacillus marianensis TaxID=3131995 RepID=UPI0030CAE8BF